MRCPHCQTETQVKDSRPQGNGAIRRRRVCEKGHKFNTYETLLRPDGHEKRLEADRARLRAWREAHPDQTRAHNKRARLRMGAKAEAKATGRPVHEILQQWGVA